MGTRAGWRGYKYIHIVVRLNTTSVYFYNCAASRKLLVIVWESGPLKTQINFNGLVILDSESDGDVLLNGALKQ